MITLSDVKRVAELASIDISEEEAMHYLDNLRSILQLANQIDNVDTQSIPAAAHCFDMKQRLRPDKITETNQRERLQKLAQDVQAGLYIVPQVIEEE